MIARDLQVLKTQWFLGWSLPVASPLGTVLTTPDEIAPYVERIPPTWANGELHQRAPLSDMITDAGSAIETISRIVALEVGDVIAMGTRSVGAVSFSTPRYLRDADQIVSEIEGIGRLENTISIR